MTDLTLHVLTTSTRPTRKGPAVAAWAAGVARDHGAFAVEAVDLADFGLPVFDEPEHPAKGVYHHEHTKAWSASVAAADAFVFVMPEYNHSMPSSLLNALTFLVREWAHKPVGFVSYGGASAGLRAVTHARPVLTSLGMMPLPQVVAIPQFQQHLDGEAFAPPEGLEKSLRGMLDALHGWAVALAPMRQPA